MIGIVAFDTISLTKTVPRFHSLPSMPYVKAQVYLLEVDVARPFNAKHPRILKTGAYHAHQTFALPQIKFGSGG
ncbi:hypothetical protein [Mucilaginibacter defluvii]|uniref:hypothetical protein n=1 Tax=Mucilaginibacter defluvii TaxID=1196019 RepID=UPI0031E95916